MSPRATIRLVLLLSAALSGACAQPKCASNPSTSAPVASAPPSAAPPSAAPTATASPALNPLAAPGQSAFASKRYRNLFVERGYPAAEIERKIQQAWASLFQGDAESQRVYFDAGSNAAGPLAYVLDIGNDDVRSEGMSYGMMIAVQLDKQAEFRALWNWAKTYMQNQDPKHPATGYFAWQLKRTGEHIDDMPAPDGEEYFTTALYFAAARWGNANGIYDYKREADELVDRIKNRKDVKGLVNGKRTTTGTALFNVKEKMVRFTPDSGGTDFTDPSYHLPAFYEIWARLGPERDRSFWREAAQKSRLFWRKAAHPKTGLTPDYANFDGTPMAAPWDKNTVQFRYDAWRTAMNWSVDYAWWASDAGETELSDRIQAFFETQGLGSYGNNFTLEGVATSNSHSLGLISTNAVASLAATQPRAALFVDELWRASPPTGKWRYYDGLLYLMSLLHVSGNFRIYGPS